MRNTKNLGNRGWTLFAGSAALLAALAVAPSFSPAQGDDDYCETPTTEVGVFFGEGWQEDSFVMTCWLVLFDEETVFETSDGTPFDIEDVPMMEEISVVGCFDNDWTFKADQVTWNNGQTSIMQSTFDETVVFANNGTSSYYVQSTSDPLVAPTGIGNPNPELSLEEGTRYLFSYPFPASHPFTLSAAGASAAGDTALLIQGSGEGELETNPVAGIDWFEDNEDFYFTVTPDLISAMEGNASQSPGYRCNIHTGAMRGSVTFRTSAGISDWYTFE